MVENLLRLSRHLEAVKILFHVQEHSQGTYRYSYCMVKYHSAYRVTLVWMNLPNEMRNREYSQHLECWVYNLGRRNE